MVLLLLCPWLTEVGTIICYIGKFRAPGDYQALEEKKSRALEST